MEKALDSAGNLKPSFYKKLVPSFDEDEMRAWVDAAEEVFRVHGCTVPLDPHARIYPEHVGREVFLLGCHTQDQRGSKMDFPTR